MELTPNPLYLHYDPLSPSSLPFSLACVRLHFRICLKRLLLTHHLFYPFILVIRIVPFIKSVYISFVRSRRRTMRFSLHALVLWSLSLNLDIGFLVPFSSPVPSSLKLYWRRSPVSIREGITTFDC